MASSHYDNVSLRSSLNNGSSLNPLQRSVSFGIDSYSASASAAGVGGAPGAPGAPAPAAHDGSASAFSDPALTLSSSVDDSLTLRGSTSNLASSAAVTVQRHARGMLARKERRMRELVAEYAREMERQSETRRGRIEQREGQLAWLKAAPMHELEAELAALRNSREREENNLGGFTQADLSRAKAARVIQSQWRNRQDATPTDVSRRQKRLEEARRTVDGPAARYQVDLLLRVDDDTKRRLNEQVNENTARMTRRWKLQPPAELEMVETARQLQLALENRPAARTASFAGMENLQRERHAAQLAASRVERLATTKLGSESVVAKEMGYAVDDADEKLAAHELHEYHLRTANLQRKLVELIGARRASALIGRDFQAPSSSAAAAVAANAGMDEKSTTPARALGALESLAARFARIDDSIARSWTAARREADRVSSSVRDHASIRASVDRALGVQSATMAKADASASATAQGRNASLDALRKIAQAERASASVIGDPAWYAGARESIQRKMRGELDADALADARRRGSAAANNLVDRHGVAAEAAVAGRAHESGASAPAASPSARDVVTSLSDGAAQGVRKYKERVRQALSIGDNAPASSQKGLQAELEASAQNTRADAFTHLERRLQWLDEAASLCLQKETETTTGYVTQATRSVVDGGGDPRASLRSSVGRLYPEKPAGPDVVELLASLDRDELEALMERLSPARPVHFGIGAEKA